MLFTKLEGVTTIKDDKGNPIAVLYKDIESADKHCLFYKLEEMGEEEIADLLTHCKAS